MMGMRMWRMVLIVGSVIFVSSLGLPLIMEGIVYGTPSEVSSAPDGASGSFVGTIKNVGHDSSPFGLGHYLEIDGFNGYVHCEKADFHVGEKVIISGVLHRYPGVNVIVGELPPGVVIMDGSLPAEIARPWWPMVSEMMMIAGIAIIPTGLAGISFSRWKRGLPSLPNPHKEPGSS
jgi:hypothetical protein